MSDLTIFSKRLKEARQKAELTQAELAEKAGTTAATISSYESIGSIKKASLDLVINFAKALNVSLDWLCGLDGIKEKSYFNVSSEELYEALAIVLTNIDVERKKYYIAPEYVSEESNTELLIRGRNICSFIHDFFKFKPLLFDENFDEFVRESLIAGTIKKYRLCDYDNEADYGVPF